MIDASEKKVFVLKNKRNQKTQPYTLKLLT